jgi:hypothetical protein
MAVYRINKTKDYTIIGNFHLREKEMSLKAKGLLTLFLSLPDDWDYSVMGITSLVKENSGTVNRIMQELEHFKYLTRTRLFKEDGKFKTWQYDIYEKPYVEKPYVENAYVENAYVENATQLNTKEVITKKPNIKNTKKENLDNLFNKFYEEYPKKKSKGNVEKWFLKNKPSEELVNKMIEKVNILKKTSDWKKENGKYIPYPSTWLNAKGWEDEITNVDETYNMTEGGVQA